MQLCTEDFNTFYVICDAYFLKVLRNFLNKRDGIFKVPYGIFIKDWSSRPSSPYSLSFLRGAIRQNIFSALLFTTCVLSGIDVGTDTAEPLSSSNLSIGVPVPVG